MESYNTKFYMGIDVSKETLDIYWKETSYTIKNKVQSISAFIKAEIESPQDVICILEYTGGYERTVVKALCQNGTKVHLAHPNRVHAFAKVCGHFAKTDKLDARLLCKYGKHIAMTDDQNMLFKVMDERHEEILTLRRLAITIERSLHKAQCQLKQMLAICAPHLEEQIALYKKQLDSLQKEMEIKIDTYPELYKKKALMVTHKGIGDKTASILLAEMPELGTLSRAQVPCLLGVVPRTYQSGKKSRPGHIFGGRFFARKAIYMAALVASRYDPLLKKKYFDLIQRGKPKKVALVAIMRHIIITLNAMLKKSQNYAFLS